MPFDDDIKIFNKDDFSSADTSLPKNDEGPGESSFDAALNLGCSLVSIMKENSDILDVKSFDGYDVPMQIKLMLAFVICSTLENYCISPQLANAALNSFYKTLKSRDAEFYEDLSSSGSISFYYLALRRSDDIERRMGQTFAMLCSKDGNGVFQELGEALYCKYSDIVKQEIGKFNLLKSN